MKKEILLAAIAIASLASCSNDDVVDVNNGNGISFRAILNRHVNRSSVTTTTNLESFFVSASYADNSQPYFLQKEFKKVVSSGNFTSDPIIYWPSEDKTLKIHALNVNQTMAGLTKDDITLPTLKNLSPKANIKDQVDIVYAYTEAKGSTSTTGISLTFKHLFSQIEIQAKNGNSGYVYKVKGVKIAMPVSKGDFNLQSSAWKLLTDKASYESTYDTEKTLGTNAISIMKDNEGNAMLIPQQLIAWKPDTDKTNASKGAYLAVKVNITTKEGGVVWPADGDYGWVAVAIDTNWRGGNKYVYTLDFSQGAGRVDPTTTANPGSGEPILGSAIIFTKISVSDWVSENQSADMK